MKVSYNRESDVLEILDASEVISEVTKIGTKTKEPTPVELSG